MKAKVMKVKITRMSDSETVEKDLQELVMLLKLDAKQEQHLMDSLKQKGECKIKFKDETEYLVNLT